MREWETLVRETVRDAGKKKEARARTISRTAPAGNVLYRRGQRQELFCALALERLRRSSGHSPARRVGP